jgi:hypothetical protein
MHQNLERRFIQLAVKQNAYTTALGCFRSRYHLLFDALAEELGITREKLGKMVGFDPVPKGGNKIMNGEAEPSSVDVELLLLVYLEHNAKAAKV